MVNVTYVTLKRVDTHTHEASSWAYHRCGLPYDTTKLTALKISIKVISFYSSCCLKYECFPQMNVNGWRVRCRKLPHTPWSVLAKLFLNYLLWLSTSKTRIRNSEQRTYVKPEPAILVPRLISVRMRARNDTSYKYNTMFCFVMQLAD